MKGERIIAEVVALVGMLIYIASLQHLYVELAGKPDRSWINQARTWWVTRGSRKLEKRLRIFTLEDTSTEPSVDG